MKTLCGRIKYGQLKRQFINFNGMLKRLLPVADPVALKLARRFHPVLRENLYIAAAVSERARQLIEAFPVLGMAIYNPPDDGENKSRPNSWWSKSAEAIGMVERGDRMNRIAGFMNVPMWARKLKPAVAHLFAHVPHVFAHYLPEKTWEQRLWIRPFLCYRRLRTDADPQFAYWIATHVLELGNRIGPVLDDLENISDWVHECRRETPRCITRPFSPDMSVATVKALSDEWHGAVATIEHKASNYRIPAPWYPSGQVDGYEIIAVDSAEGLWKEGQFMHHCVGSYDYRVSAGACHIYSVRRGDERLATVELALEGGVVRAVQIKGPCNKPAPKAITSAVRKWLKSQSSPPNLPTPQVEFKKAA